MLSSQQIPAKLLARMSVDDAQRALTVFCQEMREFQGYHVLNLDDTTLTIPLLLDDALDMFCHELARNVDIGIVKLHALPADADIARYEKIAQAIGAMPLLEELYIEVAEDCPLPIGVLPTFLRHIRQIKKLSCSCNSLDEDSLAQSLGCHPNLREIALNLEGKNRTNVMERLCSVFPTLRCLESVELYGCFTTELDSLSLNTVLALQQCKQLLKLVFYYYEIADGQVLHALGETMSFLQEFSMRDCRLSGPQAACLAKALKKSNVHSLSLHRCRVDPAFLEALAIDQSRHLKELNLSLADRLSPPQMVSLLRRMAQSSSLETVTLPDCDWDRPAIAALAAACESHTSLRHINFSWEGISPDDFDTFVASLSLNSKIESIRAPGLVVVSPLTTSRLIELAKSSYCLQQVVTAAAASDQKSKELDCWLRLNAAGRQYLVEGASLQRGLGVLANVSDSIDCIFLHLRENPFLFEHCDLHQQQEESFMEMMIGEAASYACTSECTIL